MNAPALLIQVIRIAPSLFVRNFVLQVVRSSLPLVAGLVVRYVLESIAADSRITSYFWLALALLVMAAVGLVVSLLAGVSHDGAIEAVAISSLIRAAFLRVLSRPGAQKSNHSTGSLVSRLTGDSATVGTSLAYNFMISGAGVQTLFALVVMLSIDI